ncbi:MAG: PH domain-containing protein [Clostridia bacterium]|nr:PH domain-containing protein [Clostridia bacterium]
MTNKFGSNTKILWKDRKRWCGLPWSFTRYYLVEKPGTWLKLFTSIGLFATAGEELNLYRITDISLYQSLSNKIWGTGTIVLHTNVDNQSELYIKRVKDPYKVRAMLAELVELERAKKGYRIAELTA